MTFSTAYADPLSQTGELKNQTTNQMTNQTMINVLEFIVDTYAHIVTGA